MPRNDLLTGLNDSQVAAVTHVDGPLMVLAGPGSGKTRVVTHRIAYLIESGVDPRNLVALTFTNKAAQEMRRRVEQLVGEANLWMGTFHGFCVRLLRRYARLVGLPENFSIYDTSDAESVLKVAIQKASFELTHQSLGSLANRISYFKNRLVTPEILESEALSSEEHAVQAVYPYYQRELLSNGAVDFDDILMHTAMLLRSNPELRSDWDQRLRYVMVDEYQDTNLAQYVIVRHLSVDLPNLAATGDPDQSIYGWRGANSKNVSNFERDYPGLRVVRLEDNYRSSPQILAVADHLIQHNAYRKEKHLIPTRGEGAEVRMTIYESARQEAEDIAEEVAACHERGEPLSDFAVLYRTNAQSRLFEHALMRRQLPFQLIGGYRFYMRKEIKDLVSYLLLLHNPEDDVALMRSINSPPRGIGKQTLSKIQAYATQQGLPMLAACKDCAEHGLLSKRAATAVKKYVGIYEQLRTLIHGPLTDLLESTIELTKYRAHLAKQKAGDDESDVAENLDELLAEAYEIDHAVDAVVGVDQEQSALEKFLEFAALQSESDRFDGQQDQMTLMTLHAAKGLEFPHVYIAAVEENILPHSRSKEDPMQLEEERRLFFVGITRAENHLQISYAKRRGFSAGQGSGVPSSFLMELPRGELKVIDKTAARGGYFGDGEFADSSQQSWGGDWDEFSQVDESQAQDENFDSSVDFEVSQLSPEEMQSRAQKQKVLSAMPALRVASDLLNAEPEAEANRIADVGSWVEHEKFGLGQITACEGRGPKRSATIRFVSDNSSRTFRLSFAKLLPAEPPR